MFGAFLTLLGVGVYAAVDTHKANQAVRNCHALYARYGECDPRLNDVEREVWRDCKTEDGKWFLDLIRENGTDMFYERQLETKKRCEKRGIHWNPMMITFKGAANHVLGEKMY